MTDSINIAVTNLEELSGIAKATRGYMEKMVLDVVNEASIKLHRHIREDLFGGYPGGTTAKTLASRSTHLKKSIRITPAAIVNDEVRGGISIGTSYARLHFGKAGHVTTITPKKTQYLAIPLPDAMNKNGVPKGSPRDEAIYGKTFIAKSKAGNLIIFGKLKYVKGEKAGQTKGNVKPLFILKKEVKVPVRITADDLRRYVDPILGKGLSNIKNGLLASTLQDVAGQRGI